MEYTEFEKTVIDKPTVVKFFTKDCSSCTAMIPHMEKAAKYFEGKVDFIDMDISSAEGAIADWNLASVPTTLFLAPGKKEVARVYGFRIFPQIRQLVENNFLLKE
jgi:thioredoxin-like negative regulator of GroEL